MNEAGSHHKYDNNCNQDAVAYKDTDEYFAMALADGMSTCSNARTGAKIASDTLVNCFIEQSRCFFELNTEDNVKCLISRTLNELKKTARKESIDIEEYSSTLSGILIDKKRKKIFYFNLGDCLIMATKKEKCSIISMPSDSRNYCCSTTTEDAEVSVSAGIKDMQDIRSVVICSDGAWRLMYERIRLYDHIRETLINCDYNNLKDILAKSDRFDDCSFISVKIGKSGKPAA